MRRSPADAAGLMSESLSMSDTVDVRHLRGFSVTCRYELFTLPTFTVSLMTWRAFRLQPQRRNATTRNTTRRPTQHARHPLPCRLPPVEHYYCHLQSKSVPAPSRRHHEWCPVKQRSRRSSRVILLRPGPTTLLQHVDFIDMRLVPKGVQTTTLSPMLPSRVLLS